MRGSHLYLSFGTEILYEDAEFYLSDTAKAGIVGVNGAGKTTLFKVILGERELDGGSISKGNARVGYLPQEIEFAKTELSVWDYLFDGRPIRKLEGELAEIYRRLETAEGEEQARLLSRMGKVQARLEELDVYNAENALLELVESMQIDADMLQKRPNELSGGQKSKIAFARVLFSDPQILLLDEPTNHLDAGTKDFVTQTLKNYRGSVLIISHDADFLNAVTDKTLFIDKTTHKMTVYDGNYTAFKRQYARDKLLKEMRIANQEREIRKLEDFVQRAKQASRTNHNLKRMGQDREEKLAKARAALETRDREYRRVKIRLDPKRENAKIPLRVEELRFHYPDMPPLYRGLSFALAGGERFLIVGENGAGKSTLLKLIMGILTPDGGEIKFSPKTDIAYYAQELELLDEDKNVLENAEGEGFTDVQRRNILGNFLFFGDEVFKKVRVLSPGEKARVALCKLLLQKANLLILDEPTNHLDPDTQAVIGENFRDYAGTILLVSHNPAFAEQVGITRMLVLPEGKIVDYSKELLEYYQLVNTDLL